MEIKMKLKMVKTIILDLLLLSIDIQIESYNVNNQSIHNISILAF